MKLPSKKSSIVKTTQKLKSKPHRIHGIFDTKKSKLTFVSLDLETVEMEFDISSCDERFNLVTFDVLLF